MDQSVKKALKGAGRPRSPDIEQRAVAAAYEIMAEAGFAGLSFARVSALSGIARPTLKLRWRTKEELCIATGKYILGENTDIFVPEDLKGQKIRELTITVLEGLIETLNDPERTRILSSIIAAAHFSDPLSELRQYILSRRGFVLRRLIEAGMENGEFAPDIDVDFAVDALNGPILYHTLIMGLPMEITDAARIVNSVLPRAAS